MSNKYITSPLKKRRVMAGLTQTAVSSQLGITQSQYSRLEKSKCDPTKYVVRLSKIFDCEPGELFGASMLGDIEKNFLELPTPNGLRFISREDKPDQVFLDLKTGWYKVTDIKNLLVSIKESHSRQSTTQPKPIIRLKRRVEL
tara:strand:+ start:258 stop:686 length:429 start_codon:yes stop_codon:yes gene_type:complete